MLREILLFCLFAIPLVQNSCVQELLEKRINMTDFPLIFNTTICNNASNASGLASYQRFDLCRSHSMVNPIWIRSTIIRISFAKCNMQYYTILHYNSCNASSSEFNNPIILVNVTSTLSQNSLLKNPNPNFCYNCIDSADMNYCMACDPVCNTTTIPNDLQLCYGPSSSECCQYIHNSACVLECPSGYPPDPMSICQACNKTCGNGTLSNTSCDCECNLGYSDEFCDENVCDPNPCDNLGSCSGVGGFDYNCTCQPSYSGKNCTDLDYCFSSPCINGDCISNPTNYTCTCRTGYSGNSCQNRVDPCDLDPCVNGTCSSNITSGQYMCNCTSGYTGDNCSEITSPCDPNPCSPGNCSFIQLSNYNCSCPDNLVGVNCSVTNPCTANPDQCLNNGVCNGANAAPYFWCNCPDGVYGSNCGSNAFCNDTVDPCLNNGNCTAVNATNFSCQCADVWVDEVCRNPCNNSDQCMNGGNCTRTSATPFYECSCVNGFTGANCETPEGVVPAGSTALVAGIVVAILFVVIIAVVVVILIIILLFFYFKSKKGKAEIAKMKTSKVHPTNGEVSQVDEEKKPML